VRRLKILTVVERYITKTVVAFAAYRTEYGKLAASNGCPKSKSLSVNK